MVSSENSITTQALVQQVAQKQLLLDMYQVELRSAYDVNRKQKLEAAVSATRESLWYLRSDLARQRGHTHFAQDSQASNFICNQPYTLPSILLGREDASLIFGGLVFSMKPDVPVLTLIAPAGMGKSALVWSWLQSMMEKELTPPLVVWWQFGQQNQGLPQLVAHLLQFF